MFFSFLSLFSLFRQKKKERKKERRTLKKKWFRKPQNWKQEQERGKKQ